MPSHYCFLLLLLVVHKPGCQACDDCPAHLPFCSAVGCLHSCPEFMYINGSECVNTCADQFVNQSMHCVDSCAPEEFILGNPIQSAEGIYLERKCVVTCGPGMYSNNQTCLGQCPIDLRYIDGDTGKCLQQCPDEQPFLINITKQEINYFKCSSRCPHLSENGYCTTLCSAEKVTFDSTCLDTCPDSHPVLSHTAECKVVCANMSNINLYFPNCLCSEELPYLYQSSCVEACHDQPVIERAGQFTRCLDDCDWSYWHKPKIFNKTCVAQCPSNTFVYEEKCVDICPPDLPLASRDSVCVNNCPEKEFISNGTCIEECPSAMFVYGQTCVDSCPSEIPYYRNERRVIRQTGWPSYQVTYINVNACVTECPGQEVAFNYSCVLACPNGMYISNSTCVNDCPEDTPYLRDDDNHRAQFTCAALCRSDEKYFNTTCVRNCPNDLFVLNQTCTSQCPSEFPFVQVADTNDHSCVKQCSDYEFYLKDTCIHYCPSAMVVLNNTCEEECPSSMPLIRYSYDQITQDGTRANRNSDVKSVARCTDKCHSYEFEFNQTCYDFCPFETVTYNGSCLKDCPMDVPYIRYEPVKNIQTNSQVRVCADSCDSTDVILGNDCVTRCPEDLRYLHGNTCRSDNCPRNFYKTLNYIKCVDTCGSKEFNNQNECVNRCPGKSNVYNRTCVDSCPIHSPFLGIVNDNSSCTSFPNCGAGKFVQYRSCFDTCPNHTFFLNDSCVSFCPEPYYTRDRNCEKQCNGFTFSNTLSVPTWEFNDYFKTWRYRDKQESVTICSNACSDQRLGLILYPTYSYNGKCVFFCPAPAPYIADGECVKMCPESKPFINKDMVVWMICVTKCKSYEVSINKTCRLKSACDLSRKVLFQNQCLEQCPKEHVWSKNMNTCFSKQTVLIVLCVEVLALLVYSVSVLKPVMDFVQTFRFQWSEELAIQTEERNIEEAQRKRKLEGNGIANDGIELTENAFVANVEDVTPTIDVNNEIREASV